MGHKNGLSQVVGGLGAGGLCLALWLGGITGGWILFPGIVFGALPLIKGLKDMAWEFSNRERPGRIPGKAPSRREKELPLTREEAQREILRLARDHRGILTPARVAVDSRVDLATAQSELEDMAVRGHARMQVHEDGSVDYFFPEFSRD